MHPSPNTRVSLSRSKMSKGSTRGTLGKSLAELVGPVKKQDASSPMRRSKSITGKSGVHSLLKTQMGSVDTDNESFSYGVKALRRGAAADKEIASNGEAQEIFQMSTQMQSKLLNRIKKKNASQGSGPKKRHRRFSSSKQEDDRDDTAIEEESELLKELLEELVPGESEALLDPEEDKVTSKGGKRVREINRLRRRMCALKGATDIDAWLAKKRQEGSVAGLRRLLNKGKDSSLGPGSDRNAKLGKMGRMKKSRQARRTRRRRGEDDYSYTYSYEDTDDYIEREVERRMAEVQFKMNKMSRGGRSVHRHGAPYGLSAQDLEFSKFGQRFEDVRLEQEVLKEMIWELEGSVDPGEVLLSSGVKASLPPDITPEDRMARENEVLLEAFATFDGLTQDEAEAVLRIKIAERLSGKAKLADDLTAKELARRLGKQAHENNGEAMTDQRNLFDRHLELEAPVLRSILGDHLQYDDVQQVVTRFREIKRARFRDTWVCSNCPIWRQIEARLEEELDEVKDEKSTIEKENENLRGAYKRLQRDARKRQKKHMKMMSKMMERLEGSEELAGERHNSALRRELEVLEERNAKLMSIVLGAELESHLQGDISGNRSLLPPISPEPGGGGASVGWGSPLPQVDPNNVQDLLYRLVRRLDTNAVSMKNVCDEVVRDERVLQKMSDTREELQRHLAETTDELERVREEARVKTQALTTENSALLQENAALSARVDTMASNLKRQVDKSASLSVRVDSLGRDLHKAKKQTADLERRYLDQVEALSSRVDRPKSARKHQKLKRKVRRPRSNTVSTNKSDADGSRSVASSDAYSADEGSLALIPVDDMSAENYRRRIRQLLMDAAASSLEINSLHTQVAAAEATAERLREDLSQDAAELASLRRKAENTRGTAEELSRVQQQLVEKSSALQRASNETVRLKQQLQDLEVELAEKAEGTKEHMRASSLEATTASTIAMQLDLMVETKERSIQKIASFTDADFVSVATAASPSQATIAFTGLDEFFASRKRALDLYVADPVASPFITEKGWFDMHGQIDVQEAARHELEVMEVGAQQYAEMKSVMSEALRALIEELNEERRLLRALTQSDGELELDISCISTPAEASFISTV